MSDYIERMITEARELNDRIKKLERAVANRITPDLAREAEKAFGAIKIPTLTSERLTEIDLMTRQLDAMRSYQKVLLERVGYAITQPEPEVSVNGFCSPV